MGYPSRAVTDSLLRFSIGPVSVFSRQNHHTGYTRKRHQLRTSAPKIMCSPTRAAHPTTLASGSSHQDGARSWQDRVSPSACPGGLAPTATPQCMHPKFAKLMIERHLQAAYAPRLDDLRRRARNFFRERRRTRLCDRPLRAPAVRQMRSEGVGTRRPKSSDEDWQTSTGVTPVGDPFEKAVWSLDEAVRPLDQCGRQRRPTRRRIRRQPT